MGPPSLLRLVWLCGALHTNHKLVKEEHCMRLTIGIVRTHGKLQENPFIDNFSSAR